MPFQAGQKCSLITVLTLAILFSLSYLLYFYGESNIFYRVFPETVEFELFVDASMHQKVLVPAGFYLPEETLRKHLENTAAHKWSTQHLDETQVTQIPPILTERFKKTEAAFFSLSGDQDCTLSQYNMTLFTDTSQHLKFNLHNVIRVFLEETKLYGDTYNNHIYPILKEFITEERLQKNWFRFSGSSVWLKDYNVHLVISRLVVSDIQLRTSPRLSLLLAQVFDDNWDEVKDVQIVFPTNSKGHPKAFRVNNQEFFLYRFPRFLPVPFDIGEGGQSWGAEDPRVTLVRNENGHEEPVVVFDSFHMKKNEAYLQLPLRGIRSMFMSFPFQMQQGKPVVTPDTENTENDWFTRTKRMRIDGVFEQEAEKNWVPFVSSAGEYDQHIMFATQFEPLRIIKCDLTTDKEACQLEKPMHERNVGALRGSTALISLQSFPTENREVFIGFAKAHLHDCGCGRPLDRPNLVVVTRARDQWYLSHVSLTVNLGMEILPWNPKGRVCQENNAMIPNGIEFWDRTQDIMGIDVSISDITVERVHVRGVMRALEKVGLVDFEDEQIRVMESPLQCAMAASMDYCRIYGTTHW